MTTTKDVGTQLVALCRAGKYDEAATALYAQDIVSVEAGGPPGAEREVRGYEAVLQKGAQWSAAHEIHAVTVDGPYPNGDRFIVRFQFDLTNKPRNQRFAMDEMALYEVRDGKIVREEFFYGG